MPSLTSLISCGEVRTDFASRICPLCTSGKGYLLLDAVQEGCPLADHRQKSNFRS